MKRFDPVEFNHFRQAPDGSTVFFPWRPTGRGYILPDAKRKRSAMRVTRALYSSMFVAAGLAVAVVRQDVPIREAGLADFFYALVVALVFMLVPLGLYVFWLVRTIYDLPSSDFRLSREELKIQTLANLSRNDMRKGFFASAAMLAACLGLAWMVPSHRGLGAVGIVLFGGLALLYAWTLRASREARSGRPQP